VRPGIDRRLDPFFLSHLGHWISAPPQESSQGSIGANLRLVENNAPRSVLHDVWYGKGFTFELRSRSRASLTSHRCAGKVELSSSFHPWYGLEAFFRPFALVSFPFYIFSTVLLAHHNYQLALLAYPPQRQARRCQPAHQSPNVGSFWASIERILSGCLPPLPFKVPRAGRLGRVIFLRAFQ